MKTLLFCLCAFCTFAATSFAQQVSTIQVSVSDTISVPANHLSVIVTFKDTSYAREEPIDLTPSHDAVVRLLDDNKVSWKKASEQMGFLGGLAKMGGDNGKPDLDITADFTSAAQMDMLLPKINAVAYTTAIEAGASIDKNTVDMSPLYAKLLKKARAKAEMIAGLSGKKVGAVYQIGSAFDGFNPSEAMESMMGGDSPYGGLMKTILGSMFSEKRADHQVTVKEHLTVSYLLQ